MIAAVMHVTCVHPQASVGLVVVTLVISLWVRVGTEADCVPMTALDAGTGAPSSACETHLVTEPAASLANAVCPATTKADSPFVPVTTEGDSGWMDFVGAVLWWMVALLIVECVSLFIIQRTHRGLRHLVKRGLHAADRITKGMNHVDPIVAKSSAREVGATLAAAGVGQMAWRHHCVVCLTRMHGVWLGQELGEPLRDGMYAILVRARRMKMRHWTEDYTGPTHEFVLYVHD